jgi:hypothetical protein
MKQAANSFGVRGEPLADPGRAGAWKGSPSAEIPGLDGPSDQQVTLQDRIRALGARALGWSHGWGWSPTQRRHDLLRVVPVEQRGSWAQNIEELQLSPGYMVT